MTDDNGRNHPTPLHNYRCTRCGRLLFRAYLAEGCKIHIRCPKCGRGLYVLPDIVGTEEAVMVATVAN